MINDNAQNRNEAPEDSHRGRSEQPSAKMHEDAYRTGNDSTTSRQGDRNITLMDSTERDARSFLGDTTLALPNDKGLQSQSIEANGATQFTYDAHERQDRLSSATRIRAGNGVDSIEKQYMGREDGLIAETSAAGKDFRSYGREYKPGLGPSGLLRETSKRTAEGESVERSYDPGARSDGLARSSYNKTGSTEIESQVFEGRTDGLQYSEQINDGKLRQTNRIYAHESRADGLYSDSTTASSGDPSTKNTKLFSNGATEERTTNNSDKSELLIRTEPDGARVETRTAGDGNSTETRKYDGSGNIVSIDGQDARGKYSATEAQDNNAGRIEQRCYENGAVQTRYPDGKTGPLGASTVIHEKGQAPKLLDANENQIPSAADGKPIAVATTFNTNGTVRQVLSNGQIEAPSHISEYVSKSHPNDLARYSSNLENAALNGGSAGVHAVNGLFKAVSTRDPQLHQDVQKSLNNIAQDPVAGESTRLTAAERLASTNSRERVVASGVLASSVNNWGNSELNSVSKNPSTELAARLSAMTAEKLDPHRATLIESLKPLASTSAGETGFSADRRIGAIATIAAIGGAEALKTAGFQVSDGEHPSIATIDGTILGFERTEGNSLSLRRSETPMDRRTDGATEKRTFDASTGKVNSIGREEIPPLPDNIDKISKSDQSAKQNEKLDQWHKELLIKPPGDNPNEKPADRAEQNRNLTPEQEINYKGVQPTGYKPWINNRMEGGAYDMFGRKVRTTDDFFAGRSEFVSVAVDKNAHIKDGQLFYSRELDQKYASSLSEKYGSNWQNDGKHMWLRATDTGGRFTGTWSGDNKESPTRIDIATGKRSAETRSARGKSLSQASDITGSKSAADRISLTVVPESDQSRLAALKTAPVRPGRGQEARERWAHSDHGYRDERRRTKDGDGRRRPKQDRAPEGNFTAPEGKIAHGIEGESIPEKLGNGMGGHHLGNAQEVASGRRPKGDCGRGLRESLNRSGFNLKGGPGAGRVATELGKYLESTGRFDKIPLNEVGQLKDGDILIRPWTERRTQAKGGLNKGDCGTLDRYGNLYNDGVSRFNPSSKLYNRDQTYILRWKAPGQETPPTSDRSDFRNPPNGDGRRASTTSGGGSESRSDGARDDRSFAWQHGRDSYKSDGRENDRSDRSSTQAFNRARHYLAQPDGISCSLTSLEMAKAHHLGGRPSASEVKRLENEPIMTPGGKTSTVRRAEAWPSDLHNLAELARKQNLHAEAHPSSEPFSQADMQNLDAKLDQGDGALARVKNPRTGNNHFVYIAGRDGDNYIVADPDRKNTDHHQALTRQELFKLMHKRGRDGGFVSVSSPASRPSRSEFRHSM
jgi:hypothetical protein